MTSNDRKLKKLLKQTGKLSILILEEGVKIMLKIQNGSLVEKYIETHYIGGLSKDKITDTMEEIAMELVSDAEKVKEELDNFSTLVLSSAEDDKIIAETPFLASVWFGDSYELDGPDSLITLNEDLDNQLLNMTKSTLFELTHKKLERLI